MIHEKIDNIPLKYSLEENSTRSADSYDIGIATLANSSLLYADGAPSGSIFP